MLVNFTEDDKSKFYISDLPVNSSYAYIYSDSHETMGHPEIEFKW